MTEQPLRVAAATAYPVTAASARVRVAEFVPFLAGQGVELSFRPALRPSEYDTLASSASVWRKASVLAAGSGRALRRTAAADLLLVHRLRLLNPLPGIDPPPRLDVYDFDDALFLGSAADVNRRFQWAKQEASRALRCVQRARLVIAGNGFLASQAAGHARRVEVIPSCVNPDLQPLRTHVASEVVTIGWIGSQTTSAYLKPILPVLARLNRDRLRVRLVVVGGRIPAAPWIEERPWSLERQAADLAGFDIGVMPLPDTEWAKGKCGYKLLQYFAAGVPAVASPVGVSRSLVDADRGSLAATETEWYDALRRLASDPVERAQRGAAARSFAEREFSYQRWAPVLAALLHSLN